MKVLRERKYLIALLALLVVFAACKGESPTAPTPSGGNTGGGGGGTPPVGATITLTVSNANPLVNSVTVVTATVSANGNLVPNGTAVEFQTTLGTWQDNGLQTTIRTTTNGAATAILTSATPGVAQISAIVNNVVQKTSVTFQASPTPVTPPSTTPTITSIVPSSGNAAGGDTIVINGTNFRTPIRVLFDLGGGVVKEGFVDPNSVTATQIRVVTPQVNLGAGQTVDASVILINEAGTPAEQRATSTFTFRLATLTPIVSALTPDSGPIQGGTRITIFGTGFEPLVQVSFAPGNTRGAQGWSQMQVISTTFSQIIAITPAARDVNPTGSGLLVGAVDLRVRNIMSNTEIIVPVIFRYTPAIQITGARPLAGTSLGGTEVTIDGIGFDQPVDVSIGGIVAQAIRVSGTQIVARTGALASPCSGGSGPIVVTNINNGDTGASAALFTFIGVPSIITGISSGGPIVPGSTITVTVQDPGVGPLGNAIIKFTINGTNVTPTPNVITAGTGPTTFTMVVPASGFTFPTVMCTTAAMTPGTQLGPLVVPLIFTNATTACTATADLTVQPVGPNTCQTPPTASTNAPPCPLGVVISAVASAGTATGTGTFTISNAPNARDLTLSAPVAAGTTNITTVTVAPNTAATVPGGTTAPPYTITVDPTAPGPFNGTVTFQTNDPTKASFQICFSGNAT